MNDTDGRRRRWPRLVLTISPDASDALGSLARSNYRDRRQEALRLILEGIDREGDRAVKSARPER